MKLAEVVSMPWPLPKHMYRQWGLKLQQELIDLLPDDFEIDLTDKISHVDQEHGEVAVKVWHPSYTDIAADVLVFPAADKKSNANEWAGKVHYKLVYMYVGEYRRMLIYSHISGDPVPELAKDLEKNIQTNSV